MRKRSRGAAIVAAALLGLGLAGCGAGQDAPTSRVVPAVPGVNVDAEDGSVVVRNALVPYQPQGYRVGGQVPVEMRIVNQGLEPVRLVSASSEQAARAQIAGEAVIPPGVATPLTLRLGDLRAAVNATSRIPLVLRFDNGVELSMQVPVAPPERPEHRTPMDLEQEH
ncbi:MAG: hypothetical protein FWJ70_09340 [Micromonosporaceae bacterium]